MSIIKNNNIFEKTSFLGNNSSEFIEELYAQYITNPQGLTEEWKEFFKGLQDNKELIINTVNGPSWSPKKKKKFTRINGEKINDQFVDNVDISGIKENAKNSIRVSTLTRAYRIRGHMIANLDPLSLLKREEHSALKPETYGLSKKDENKKIFLDGTLGMETSNIKEIIKSLRKL